MATIDIYKIKVQVSGDRDVKDLQKNVDDLADKFDSAGKAALGFAAAAAAAFTAVAVDAFRTADALVDMANGVGMATARVYQLSVAAEQSGGKFDDVGKLLAKFGQSIDQAAQGSRTMQRDLAKVGITLEDLRTLSAEELFNKAAQGAARLGTGLDVTATLMAIFGKAARDINFIDFARNMGLGGAEAERAAALFEKAAQGADKIELAYRNLQLVALDVFEPVLDALAKLDVSHDSVRDTVIKLGTAFAALAGLGVAMSFIKMATAAIAFARAVSTVVKSMSVLVALTGVGIIAVGAAVAAGEVAYSALDRSIARVADGLEDTADATDDAADALARFNEQANDGNTTLIGTQQEIIDLDQRQVDAAKAKTQQLQNQIDSTNELRRRTIGLIGEENNRANLMRANLNVEARARNEIAAIESQINVELSKGSETNQDLVKELRAQVRVVENQVSLAKQLNDEEYRRLLNLSAQQRAIEGYSEFIDTNVQREFLNSMLQSTTKIGEERQEMVDNARTLLDLQRNLYNVGETISAQLFGQNADFDKRLKILDIMVDLFNDTNQILAEQTDQQEAADIIRQRTLDAIQDMRDLGIEISEEESKILQLIIAQGIGRKEFIRMTREYNDLLNDQNDAHRGALNALDQISKTFTPYSMAQDAILSTWNKIGSAIDTFVDTGKLKFSDFAKSVLRDLAKMIIKAQIFKAISGFAGSFGLSIPGLATGGPAKAGQPYIVGEKGPELFVPQTSGNVVPNNKLGGTGAGVVNAPVTNNYITNQISALDAKSVAQLFAENRQALLGTVEYARKETAYGF
jgi:hypothetical protein